MAPAPNPDIPDPRRGVRDPYRDAWAHVLGVERPAAGLRRRAVLILGGVGVLGGLLLVGLVVFLSGIDAPPEQPARPEDGSSAPAPLPTGPGTGSTAAAPGGSAVEVELATRPMLQLAESAALPHPLTGQVAGPPITLPAPAGPAAMGAGGVGAGGVVVDGFPATAEGAVAQLVEVTRVGLAGGDPDGFALAYRAVAAPGAPPVESTGLHRGLRRVRAVGGLPPAGAVPGLVFTWTPTSALVKGSLDAGRYVVVCVLGELAVGVNGQSMSSGAGTCAAMRRHADRWQIAPGPSAAPAALAWPGTLEAVRAGYRDLDLDPSGWNPGGRGVR